MAKIYIAARFSRRPECNALAHRLQLHGHTITSRWVKPETDHVLPTGMSAQAADAERTRFALEDVDDVVACDWMVSLQEEPRSNGRGGRHVELGMAIALGKRITIIGPRETVFHHLPHVEHYDSSDEFMLLEATRPFWPGERSIPLGVQKLNNYSEFRESVVNGLRARGWSKIEAENEADNRLEKLRAVRSNKT